MRMAMSKGCSKASQDRQADVDTREGFVVLGGALRYQGTTTKGRNMTRPAADCTTMAEIRVEIDRVDAELVALFAQRASYIDRAAVIKTGVGLPARIDDRVEDVVAKVRAHAVAHGLPPDVAESLWRRVIDWSIEREERVLGQ